MTGLPAAKDSKAGISMCGRSTPTLSITKIFAEDASTDRRVAPARSLVSDAQNPKQACRRSGPRDRATAILPGNREDRRSFVRKCPNHLVYGLEHMRPGVLGAADNLAGR